MNLFALPWLELSVAIPLVGAACVSRLRDPDDAYRWCVGFTGAALACALLAAFGYSLDAPAAWGLLPRAAFAVDELSAPLLPLVALLHFLTALATARKHMTRSSFAWLLAGDALSLAAFACVDPWALIGLAALATLPPAFKLRNREKPTRVYVTHMCAFVALLIGGWALAANLPAARGAAAVLLLGAVMVRSGAVPFHLWVPDLCENGTFGNALVYVTPLTGVYLAVRLLMPVAPNWAMTALDVVALITAVYAAAMATVQTDARRLFAFLLLSNASLILVGLEADTVIELTGALALWLSVGLSLGGLGLTLRALEARLGRLSLTEHRGLYEHSPALAVCFLLTGLASVGFPGTMGFVASEMLVTGVVEVNPAVGVVTVTAAALNGIAILRAYLLLFTGRRHVSAVSLAITARERFAILTLAALILLGGLIPQPYVSSRFKAAETILGSRKS